MKVRPLKRRAELPRNRALGVVAVSTQIPPSDTPSQGQDRSKQHNEKLPLWLTHSRHLRQNVSDNVIGQEPLERECTLTFKQFVAVSVNPFRSKSVRSIVTNF